MITHKRLKELLHYDPATGVFIWIVGRQGHKRAGSIAGGVSKVGYYRICIDQKMYQAHRLAWLYMTGENPENEIDHINLDRKDNRFINLRLSTRNSNQYNTRAHKDNASGYKGVYWNKHRLKWQSGISANGKRIHVGYFNTPEDAFFAYCEAAKKYHGEFARVS